MNFLTMQDILDFFGNFYKLFDAVRVVDPQKKKVICFNDGEELQESSCYDFWKKGVPCKNCVSARALAEKDTFMKVEYRDGKTFLILASPVKFGGGEHIIEMIKDITETGLITNLYGKSIKETNNLIFELNEKTILDELTGCYNRRYINKKLPEDIYRAAVNDKPLAVLMLDVDYFKQTNDTYGHLGGDEVLKALSCVIKSKIRENFDWVARFGGEEFLIVLRDADYKAAYKIAEKIRLACENKVIKYERHRIKTTISIGSYIVEPGEKSFDEVIELADKNLYKAKKYGKNRIIAS